MFLGLVINKEYMMAGLVLGAVLGLVVMIAFFPPPSIVEKTKRFEARKRAQDRLEEEEIQEQERKKQERAKKLQSYYEDELMKK